MAFLHKMIGRHLRQPGDGRSVGLFAFGSDAVAGLYQRLGATGVDLGFGVFHKLIHIALVVREQNIVLKVLRLGRRIMLNAVQ